MHGLVYAIEIGLRLLRCRRHVTNTHAVADVVYRGHTNMHVYVCVCTCADRCHVC